MGGTQNLFQAVRAAGAHRFVYGNAAERVNGTTPPMHRRRLDFFQKSLCFILDDTCEVLRFEPEVRFPEGALTTAARYRDQELLAPAWAA